MVYDILKLFNMKRPTNIVLCGPNLLVPLCSPAVYEKHIKDPCNCIECLHLLTAMNSLTVIYLKSIPHMIHHAARCSALLTRISILCNVGANSGKIPNPKQMRKHNEKA